MNKTVIFSALCALLAFQFSVPASARHHDDEIIIQITPSHRHHSETIFGFEINMSAPQEEGFLQAEAAAFNGNQRLSYLWSAGRHSGSFTPISKKFPNPYNNRSLCRNLSAAAVYYDVYGREQHPSPTLFTVCREGNLLVQQSQLMVSEEVHVTAAPAQQYRQEQSPCPEQGWVPVPNNDGVGEHCAPLAQ